MPKLNVPRWDRGFAFLIAPYERTTSLFKGAALGPGAVLRDWRRLQRHENLPEPEIILRLPPSALAGVRSLLPALRRVTGTVLDRSLLPVLLGGEHTVTLGAVAEFAARRTKLGVIQLDAHADLRDRYQGSRYSHACTMRRVREDLQIPVLPVGIRALSRQEADYLRRRRPGALPGRRLGNWKKSLPRLLSRLPRFTYLTVDMDFFDPAVVPGVGTPEPGGAGWYQALDILSEIARHKTIVGLDVVELCPPREKKKERPGGGPPHRSYPIARVTDEKVIPWGGGGFDKTADLSYYSADHSRKKDRTCTYREKSSSPRVWAHTNTSSSLSKRP